MKFKKFLIIILSVALLSCFAVSTFATDATTAATIPDYGFYITPGDYVFNEFLSGDYSFSLNELYSNSNIVFSVDSFYYYGIRYLFYQSDYSIMLYLTDTDSNNTAVYDSRSSGWFNDDYRYITVLDGFYVYDPLIYQWWLSNLTLVESSYDNNLLDGILSSFTFIGEWIAGAANAVTPMFWDGEALTVVGTLSVAGLSFAVVFLLIALVSSFMKFRS